MKRNMEETKKKEEMKQVYDVPLQEEEREEKLRGLEQGEGQQEQENKDDEGEQGMRK
jgi:hypothetical protein